MSNIFKSLALAASLLAAPAIALADAGFEPGSTVPVVSGPGTFLTGASFAYSYTTAVNGFDANGTVTPVVGSSMGIFSADGDETAPYVIDFSFAPTNAGDSLYLGLVAADALPGVADDYYVLEVSDSTGVYYTDTIYASSLVAADGFYPFSGWFEYKLGEGTTSIKISLFNQFDAIEPPTLLVDYYNSPVTVAVPEAETTALALAGLGVVGFVASRRRRLAA